jgi:hypothetical protein
MLYPLKIKLAENKRETRSVTLHAREIIEMFTDNIRRVRELQMACGRQAGQWRRVGSAVGGGKQEKSTEHLLFYVEACDMTHRKDSFQVLLKNV